MPSIVTLRYRSPTLDSCLPAVLHLPLEYGPTAPSTARHRCRAFFSSWGMNDDQIYDGLVIVSELVTNAVTHAAPPVTLHLRTNATEGRIQIYVSDGGPEPCSHAWAAHRPRDEHGRGAAVISALANL
ncbi:ATP-binding protein [Streptomyces collinus]|uniref:ATP-binding protein n=1 Tax=Streptomyces collinus TaxID=42684 RepID=UPI0036AFC355